MRLKNTSHSVFNRNSHVFILTGVVGIALFIGSCCSAAVVETALPTTLTAVGYDPLLDEWGVAVVSEQPFCGAAIPAARAGIGVTAVLGRENPAWNRTILRLLEKGSSAQEALDYCVAKDRDAANRQALVIDGKGNAALHSGAGCPGWSGAVRGINSCFSGVKIKGETILISMNKAFTREKGKSLAMQLMTALAAGLGTDSGKMLSAALLVVRKNGGIAGGSDRMIDLRIDRIRDPIHELMVLYRRHEALLQSAAYLRAAATYSRNKRKHEAALDRAVSIAERFGRNANQLNAVAWFLAQHNTRLHKALSLIRKALARHPDVPEYWDTKAEILKRLEQYTQAVEAETKAVTLSGNRTEFVEKCSLLKGKM